MNLPKVYQNRNVGNVNNDQEFFYSANPSKAKQNVNTEILEKIIYF